MSEEIKNILDDVVMTYISENYEKIGIPRPNRFEESRYGGSGKFDDDDCPPLECNFIEYYINPNHSAPMWLRIILRYFDENIIPGNIWTELRRQLDDENIFCELMNSAFQLRFSKGEFNPAYVDIVRYLRKFGMPASTDEEDITLITTFMELDTEE